MDPRSWLFDKRVVKRNLNKEVLSPEEYNRHNAGLPDLGGECETIEMSQNARGGESKRGDLKNKAAGSGKES